MITNDYSNRSFVEFPISPERTKKGLKTVLLGAGIFLGILLLYNFIIVSTQPHSGIQLSTFLLKLLLLAICMVVVHYYFKNEETAAGEELFKEVMDLMQTVPAPMVIIGSDGKMLIASNHLYERLNLPAGSLSNNSFTVQVQEKYRQDFNQWLASRKITFRGELSMCSKHSIWITVHGRQYKSNGHTYYLATVDLPAAAQADISNYWEFTDRFETVLNSTENVVWDYDFKTGESYYNHSIYRLLGYTANEVMGNPRWWSGNIHEDDRERVLESLKKAIDEKKLFWEEMYSFRCADGGYKVIKDNGYIKRNEDGEPYRLFGFMHDVTKQEELQKQLQKEQVLHKIELAKAISDAQETERKIISEELHDNVCQVLGGVKLFIEHSMTSEEKNNALLKQSTLHLNDAINELRKMAHVLSPYIVEEFGLLSAIRELVYFAANFRKTTVNLAINHFDESILSNHKKLLLYRIIQEQLNNIIKHSRATTIDIQLSHVGRTCYFLISDNGIGMQSEKLNNGLGLKNIRNRVELMNGKVQFDSAPGKGFSIQVQFDADNN